MKKIYLLLLLPLLLLGCSRSNEDIEKSCRKEALNVYNSLKEATPIEQRILKADENQSGAVDVYNGCLTQEGYVGEKPTLFY